MTTNRLTTCFDNHNRRSYNVDTCRSRVSLLILDTLSTVLPHVRLIIDACRRVTSVDSPQCHLVDIEVMPTSYASRSSVITPGGSM